MASAWQMRVNAQNAAKSTGPRSETGKAIASRNAVTHGYYSQVSGDAEFEAERENWVETFAPRNAAARTLADLAFSQLKRLRRLQDAEEATAELAWMKASSRFDLERHDRTQAAIERLVDAPYASYLELTSHVAGCDALSDVLDRLDEHLERCTWDEGCAAALCAAGGKGAESRDPILFAASEFVAAHQPKNVRRPSAEWILDQAKEKPGSGPSTEEWSVPEEVADRLIQAWEIVYERIEGERATIAQIREALVDADEEERSRGLYLIRSRVDESKEGRTLGRCLSQATSAFHRTFAALRNATDADLAEAPAPRPNPAPAPSSLPEPPPSPSRNEPKSKLNDDSAGIDWSAPANFAVGIQPTVRERPARSSG